MGRGSRVAADEDACAAAGVEIVRRRSGGGPVVWGPHLLAFDVVIPRGHHLHTPDITAAYEWLGRAIAEALREVGVAGAHAVEPAEARRLNDPEVARVSCFAGVSPWEVLVGDRKIAGLSQIRRKGRIALQAGVLVGPEAPPVLSLIAETVDDAVAARVDTGTTAVAGPDTDAIRDAIDTRVLNTLAGAPSLT